MDVNRALRTAAQTGKVLLGAKETLNAVNAKDAKLVILSANAPAAERDAVQDAAGKNGIAIYEFRGSNHDLGPACGKPFSVSMLTVVDAGESDVLALARTRD